MRCIFPSLLLVAVVATTGLAGCRRTVVYDEPTYRQWENDTHREHREFNQRRDDERREYDNWRREHERHQTR